LVGKALVEFPQRFGGRRPVNPEAEELGYWKGAEGLADDVRHYGQWMRNEAERRIGHFYPKVTLKGGKEATVIAWLWARTVPSPDPRANGAPVPLASSFVLSSKAGKEVIVRPVVDRARQEWRFEVDDKPNAEDVKSAKRGTKSGSATFTCLLTGAPIHGGYIDTEAKAGRMAERLMAIVAENGRGRIYLSPAIEQASGAETASQTIAQRGDEMNLPKQECRGTFASNAQGRHYKFKTFADYFTPRQLVALATFSDLVGEARERALEDAHSQWTGAHVEDTRPLAEGGSGPTAYADALATYLAMVVDRMAFYGSSLCRWLPKDNAMGQAMATQSVTLTWDFAEGNPLGKSSSDITTCVRTISDCIDATYGRFPAEIEMRDAQQIEFPKGTVFSTDPPWYNNIGYADLSDFFYVWLRRTLYSIYPPLFRRVLTPKVEELVASPYRHTDKEQADKFFSNGMKRALENVYNSIGDVPAVIYYAYKQQEASEDLLTSPGWSSFLQAVTDAGLVVDGTWPVRSESGGRSTAQGTNALGCRFPPRFDPGFPLRTDPAG
jgi:putative DNA methylase